MYCRNSTHVLDWGNKPRTGVTVKTMAMQSQQTCESSSSAHSLRNTFPERKLSESHIHLPQECLSSCSRHPSHYLHSNCRGNHIHTQTRMSWTSPNHTCWVFSLPVTLERKSSTASKGGTPEKRPCVCYIQESFIFKSCWLFWISPFSRRKI